MNKTQEQKLILNYGLFVVIHIGIAILLTLLVGIVTSTLLEITIISIVMSSIKRNSGGVHSSSPERCLITGLILTLSMAFIGKILYSNLNQHELLGIIVLMQIISYFILYKKCPVPSKNKPLRNKKRRVVLRKNCFRLFYIYLVIILILYIVCNSEFYEVLMISISLGITLQVVALTDMGNKLISFLEAIFDLININ